MQIRKITDLNELIGGPQAWNALASGVPFRSFEWLRAWWDSYQPAFAAAGRHTELFTICVFDDEQLIGAAPWYLDHSRSAGSIVRFLGSGEVCSDYLSVLAAAGRQQEVAETIADWLTASPNSSDSDHEHWDLLEWSHVDAEDDMLSRLGTKLGERGAEVHTSVAGNTWRIELPKTVDGYLNLLSKSHRKQLRQLRRRMFETGEVVLRTVQDVSQLDLGWRILTDLHQRRLQSLGKLGCFKSEAFARFHRTATEALFHAGRLRLHWLEMGARPVAAEYHVAGDDVVYAYQGGIEPDALECEPGRLITLATLEQVITEGYQAFDFCRGDEPYKAHWRAQPRINVNVRVVCNRASSRLRHGMWNVGQHARNWVKGSLQFAIGKTK